MSRGSGLKSTIVRLKDKIRQAFLNRIGSNDDGESVTATASLYSSDSNEHLKSNPFINITDDVLKRIFISGETDMSDNAEKKKPLEMVVSHVSSHWRDVAINYPALWSVVDSRHYPLQPGKALTTYIERSHDVPLDLRVALSKEAWFAHGVDIVTPLTDHADRWERLRIFTDFEEGINVILHHFGSLRAPLLVHLSVICLGLPDMLKEYIDGPTFSPQILRLGTPFLSTLRIQNVGMDMLRPPLSQITTLFLEEFPYAPMTYARFSSMLQNVPLLRNLSLYGKHVESWPGNAIAQIVLPSLQSLRVCDHEDLRGLLLSIRAPKLHSLHIRRTETYPEGILPARFWQNPQIAEDSPKFPLQSLTLDIEGTAYSLQGFTSTVREFALAFPSIMNLTVLSSDASGVLDLLQSEPPEDGSTPILHRLHTLTLHHLTEYVDADSLISETLQKRVALNVPIAKLKLHRDLFPRLHSVKSLEETFSIEEWHQLATWPEELALDEEDLFPREL